MRRLWSSLVVCAILPISAQNRSDAQTIPARAVVTSPVNEAQLVTLSGNVRPELSHSIDFGAIDLGPVEQSRELQHVLLQLKRPPEREQALEEFLTALHNTTSPNYHKWITAAEFNERFGLAAQDVMAVTDWLESYGLAVHAIYPNLAIDFSGTAGQVAAALHTSIHSVQVAGSVHMANMSELKVPAALAAVIAGPASLNDFRPRPAVAPHSAFTVSSTLQLVAPADLQKIYNFDPLYAAGISGKDQEIAVVEDSDMYSTGDWNAFRKTLGLALKYPSAKLTVVHPQGFAGTCIDPGDNSDDSEATLDAEWASAAAPDATILLASCASSDTGFGVFIALQNLITSANPPRIISISFIESEAELGSGGNAYLNALYQFAVAQGISIFVAAGDSGAAGSDLDAMVARHGIGANGIGSPPNDVAVGGTDFGDSFLGENATYWSSANNPLTFGSALSYIPEIPWNDSCASQLIWLTLGYSTPYGALGFCNSSIAEQFGLVNTAAGSGAPSSCATGNPSVPAVVSGTCAGYAKPSYQASIFGNPSDKVRDVPDVSLFASNGIWGHYYLVCYSSPQGGGSPCTNNPATWAGFGGTSVSTPIMAGVQALVNQATGAPQGNPNYVYYSLATTEYGTSGSGACNSTLGNATDPGCIFYDVTLGDMDVPCQALSSSGHSKLIFNCYYPSTNPGTYGVLSTSNAAYEPAYTSQAGWDFATGIGTVNAYNLVANWPGSRLTSVLSANR